ncbi:MAG: ribosome biogenesis GTPase Der [Roseiflexaceae bacterium]|jgi:GTP-binding protein|nr:ribosome biogenesis GTPase Der [Chloroflexaceae bacterium]
MMKPIVAIVGRPNVGKSTFFNRLIGQRKAIVEDLPGTTRDRLYGECEWNGRIFTVVDTAGLLFEHDDLTTGTPQIEIARQVRAQVKIALEEADIIIFVVDIVAGITAADDEVAVLLRRSNKPIILAANKSDSLARNLDAVEFYALNLGHPIPMSAYHGIGTGDVLDAVTDLIPALTEPETDETVRIALVGRPNVGKSSLLNRLVGSERSVVSSVPGTTRDAIDTPITIDGEAAILIDTAGVRRRGRVEPGVEKHSVLRTLRAIERADVAVLLIDAEEGVTAQDTHIAGMILDNLKGVVILVNKWDLIIKDDTTFNTFTRGVRDAFKFISYAPLIFISAKTGQRVDQVLPTAMKVAVERRKRVATSQLNALLRQALYEHPPTSIKVGAHLRIYYATQPQINPPVFLFFANDAQMIHWGYARYLENKLREKFGYMGTPIKIVFRGRVERDPNDPKPKKRRQSVPDPQTTVAIPLDEEAVVETWDGDDFDDEAEVFWVTE